MSDRIDSSTPKLGSEQLDGTEGGTGPARPTTSLRRYAAAIVTAVVLLALVGAAFAAEKVFTPKPTKHGGYSVSVIHSGKVLKRFSLRDLQTMPAVTIQADGQPQKGPSVLAVLASAGATDYATLVVHGLGIRDSGILTVARSKLASAVLDFADKRPTVKFVAPQSVVATRVRDVTSLEVR